MTLVQEFLRGGGTLAELQAGWSIQFRRGVEFPNLVLLKYHMIDSPMGNPMVQQCRGIILDEANNWEVVSRPFDKFFNYGEGHAAKLDWDTARVQEKLDGSLMQLYFYRGQWRVGTSGTPDGSGEVNGCGFDFATLFWRVWNELGYMLPDPSAWGMYTFMFELMTPYNRVVVRHDANRLVLIGIRMPSNGWEWAPLSIYNWQAVREFPLQTPEQIEATFEAMNPLGQEGYVVVDREFHRLKVKHPGYVAIHHMRDGFGPKRILEVVRSGESSELLTHFPEWTEAFNKIQAEYDALVREVEASFVEATAKTEAAVPAGVFVSQAWLQKEFASHAVKSRYSPALFQLRKGQVASVRQSLARMGIDHLMELLKLKDMEL